MESIRKWFYKPKRDDTSLLAQFFYADEALNLVAAELDSFDGRKDPERCSALVNHLRQCQDRVLTICNRIMDDVIPSERANRDFRVKFPDDVMQENLAGQLWFGAECLAAGSSIMNRESESAAMRPLAKALTKALENVRNLLREQCLRGSAANTTKPSEVLSERLQEALKIFDRLFAEFELSYVEAMVPVKTPREYELQQLVVVLFSETLQRALQMKLLTQEMVDDYDPALMFTIPRLAIVSGLLIFPDGPLCLDRTPADMSEMFRPFRTLLHKIRELLWTLNKKELFTLEKLLCSSEEPSGYCNSNSQQIEPESIPEVLETRTVSDLPTSYPTVPDLDDFVTRFYIDYPSCKQFVSDFYATTTSGTDAANRLECNGVDNAALASWENTEESEDETEWVGETSECETLVTDVLNGDDGIVNEAEKLVGCSDSEGKTSILLSGTEGHSCGVSSQCISESSPLSDAGPVTFPSSEMESKDHPTTGEASLFSENIQQIPIVSTLPFPSSSLIIQNQDHFICDTEDHSTMPDTFAEEMDSDLAVPTDLTTRPHQPSESIQIPNGNSGFLLANQVGHESMLAMEGPDPRDTAAVPCSGESLPDGDSREALSVATATLSTLLLISTTASPSGGSPTHRNMEEDPSIQSPIDSGLGTVVSCSDAGSFSDRSPDGAPAVDSEGKADELTVLDSSSDAASNSDEKFVQHRPLETIPCVCTLSSRPTSASVNTGIVSSERDTCTSPINSSLDYACDTSGGASRLSINPSLVLCEDQLSSHHSVELQTTTTGEHCSNCDNSAFSGSDLAPVRQESPSLVVTQCNEEEDLNFDKTNITNQNDECLISNYNADENETVSSNSVIESDIIPDTSNNTELISSTLAFSNSSTENIFSGNFSESRTPDESFHFSDRTVLSRELNLHSETFVSRGQTYDGKVVPSVVVRTEGDGKEKGEGEEWVGVASGEGQCTLCSSNTGSEVQSRLLLLNSELDYSSNWDYLHVQQGRLNAGSSSLKQETVGSSPSNEPHKHSGVRWRGKRRGASPGSLVSKKQLQSSTAKVVPSHPNRGLEPVASSYSSTCSSCQSSITISSDSCSTSSETSSFNSECQDDEEIALAMQAAEIANRNEARAKFRSSEDLVHRLFVCIAGVADQLQTNFAGDLRNILKCVFLISASGNGSSSGSEPDGEVPVTEQEEDTPPSENDTNRPVENAEEAWESPPSPVELESPPPWVPDGMAPRCMSCEAVFTVVRRRHHCRNCGKVFCARCSSNSVPLPRYGHVKPVRVCNRCFLYQVTPFTLEEVAATRS